MEEKTPLHHIIGRDKWHPYPFETSIVSHFNGFNHLES